MKNSLRRLLMRLSVEQRDPETDDPFLLASGEKSWVYIDVRKTILLPHGLYAAGAVLLDAYLSDEPPEGQEEVTIGAIAGPALGGVPLAASLTLSAYAFDQQEAPPMLLVRKEPKGHGNQNQVEGLSNVEEGVGVLIVEDVVTTGGSTIQTIEALKAAGLNPQMVIALVDREQGGLDRIAEHGVRAISVYKLSDLTKLDVDDHILFMPSSGEHDPEGTYWMLPEPGGWVPCSPEQNEWLHEHPDLHIGHEPTPEQVEGLSGAEAFKLFYVEGILKP